MASYPSSVKTFSTPSSTTQMDDSGFEGDTVISDIHDEIEAIETELGAAPKTITQATTPAATPASVAEFLDMVATQLKAITGGANWYTSVGTSLATDVAALATHIADTTTHGTTGNVVGETDTQTLTNKTLTSPTINTGTLASPVINAAVSGTAILDEDDMTSDSATKLATQQSIKAYVDTAIAGVASNTDGWITSADTWVYASASTFTIAGVDRTTTFTKGTRLKFTQTTAKYAVVVSSSFSTNTTVTIAVNTDYTIANAAITSPYYSYAANPQGYPGSFTFTPTYTGFSSNPTMVCTFNVVGNLCTTIYGFSSVGTSNATSLTMTLPFSAVNSQAVTVLGRSYDNGAEQTAGQGTIATGTPTVLTCYKGASGVAWTGSGNKFWEGQVTYKF